MCVFITDRDPEFGGWRSSMKIYWITLLFVFFVVGKTAAQTSGVAKEVSLNDGWKFRETNKIEWRPAAVPGCVHTDLIANKLIEDPFYRDNEKRLQWIGKTDWEYTVTFRLSPEMLGRQNLEIVFDGLDTYANVFLNDRQILDADNMFRMWRANIKDVARPGENILLIKFRWPVNEIL